MPKVVHWGADLGELSEPQAHALIRAATPGVPHAGLDTFERPSVLSERLRGQAGPLGVSGRRGDGTGWSVHFTEQVGSAEMPAGVAWGLGHLAAVAEDPASGLRARSELVLHDSGILEVVTSLTNISDTVYQLDGLTPALPVPATAQALLSLSGHWAYERIPELLPISFGVWQRDSTEGRSGHDFPIALTVCEKGCGWRHGEAWALSLCWSGNHRHTVERRPDGTTWVSAAELILPGEIDLEPGETYTAPRVLAAWSDRGLDGISQRYHSYLRARDGHPRSPRPLTLNSWEAVYFDIDERRLEGLAETAAEVGVERFVVDDGWFHLRTSDRRGLGDWWVDTDRLPSGLSQIAGRVGDLGMELGLWVEPEMVNLDSDVARAHPDWILQMPGRLPREGRHQQVLDLTNDEAFEYIFSKLNGLLGQYPISYLKWDHNRPLSDAGDRYARPAAHRQTLALYRLLAALREKHPQVEIESCASGGGRVDLGMAQFCERFWASDTNDPLDRQQVQRWTSLVLPLEMIGSHVGAPRAHVTGRHADLSFRAATALFAHAGIEWDLTKLTSEDLDFLRRWADLYKARRALLHSGTLVRSDHPDPRVVVQGVVATDQSEALYCYAQLGTSRTSQPAPLRLDGLSPARAYRLKVEDLFAFPRTVARSAPPWWPGPVEITGKAARAVGVTLPILAPAQAVVVHLASI
ncbi:MAG: alpha-galactosidase [Acidimicrobiales bacterium]